MQPALGPRGEISAGPQAGLRAPGSEGPGSPASPGQPYPSPEARPYACPEPPYLRGHSRPAGEPSYSQEAYQVPHDRNHNSPGYSPRVPGQCGRPGCHNPVTKASDGTESTYCSSECVVGQCREVYTSWSSHHNPALPAPGGQPVPAQVK